MQPLSGKFNFDETKSSSDKRNVDEGQAKVNEIAKSPLSASAQPTQAEPLKDRANLRWKIMENMQTISSLKDIFSELEKLGLYNPNVKTESEMNEALIRAEDKHKKERVYAFMRTENPNEIIFCTYSSEHKYSQRAYNFVNERGGYFKDDKGNPIGGVLDIIMRSRLQTDIEVFSPPTAVEKGTKPLDNESAKEALTRLKWYSSETAKREAQLNNGLLSEHSKGVENPFVFRDATDVGFTIMYVKNGKVLKDKFQIKNGKWTKWPEFSKTFDSPEEVVRFLQLDPNYKFFK